MADIKKPVNPIDPSPEEPPDPADTADPQRELDAPPKVVVLGHMENNVALRLGWKKGIQPVSLSRFKFLRDALGFEIEDTPEKYLF